MDQITQFCCGMLPSSSLFIYTSQLQNSGLNVDSSSNSMDLMSGQEEGEDGDEQTLLIWTANSKEVGLGQVIQALQDITETLPYG